MARKALPLQRINRMATPNKDARIREFEALIPPLPEDHPLYSMGWIVGQTFAGASPTEAHERSNDGPSSRKVQKPAFTPEQLRAALGLVRRLNATSQKRNSRESRRKSPRGRK